MFTICINYVKFLNSWTNTPWFHICFADVLDLFSKQLLKADSRWQIHLLVASPQDVPNSFMFMVAIECLTEKYYKGCVFLIFVDYIKKSLYRPIRLK